MSDSYNAARHLLLQSTLAEDAADWLDDLTEHIAFDKARAERHLSSGEVVILEAAQALYNGYGLCSLGEAIATLDSRHYRVLVEAMKLRRLDCFTERVS